MISSSLHIIFAGGGTAGHLFPGLAVAECLADELPGVRITFVGAAKPLERRQVAQAGFDYVALPCRPMSWRPTRLVSAVLENAAGYFVARRLLKEDPCAAVIGLGAYVSVPMARAASRSGVPLILLEQNAVPGRATRWLARHAVMICAAFAEIRSALPAGCRVLVTGNPVRRAFDRFSAARGDHDIRACRQVLVLGGSSGAHSLNENVPRALYKIREELAGWQVLHQSGTADFDATRSLYQKLGIEARVEPFVSDMPAAMAASGLVVCRAGGSTLAELAVAGLPAVLVPYPHSADAHQQRNVAVYAGLGACIPVDEGQAAGRFDDSLADAIRQVVIAPDRRSEMSSAMSRLARPHAASEVAAVVREFITPH